jgi:transcriptional regulator with XRE-family HTH domain
LSTTKGIKMTQSKKMNIIRFIRTELGMTQVEFTKITKVKQTTISDYERGKIKPSQRVLRRIIKCANDNGIELSLDDIYKALD